VANIISGFIIVFGGKLRKGDWIKVGDKLGMVTHIYLRATNIWTRDNIEYIVPNTDLISKPLVNYTLTSPIVRIYVPVGVSYDAAPSEVVKVLLKCAEKHQMVTQFRKPEVRIAGFGDSSLDFELLVWIDVSKIAEKDIKSRLYFTIIEALNEAGIDIPNPQRDIHIRTGPVPPADSCSENQRDSFSAQD
jgi:small-conductance mechanosensitive channel